MMLNTSEVLDLSKENVQPLRQGRKAAQLKTALQAQNDPETQHRLLKQREEYEYLIRTYEGDDPLEPYFNYVVWLEQSFTKLNRDNNLVPLLEDILIKFKDNEKYKQDARFIQLLIKYIHAQSNPIELYQHAHNQGLGTMCSILYKAWAEEFDRNNDFKRADQIYQMGIMCRSQPLQELQEAHIQFQLSIARRMLEGNINNNEPTNENPSRTALSKLQPSKVKTTRISKETAGIFQQCSKNQEHKTNGVNVGGKFTVFQEDENVGKSEFKVKSEKLPKGTVAERENIMKARKWCGQKQKQKAAFRPSMPSTLPFEIHEDPEAVCDSIKTVTRPQALSLRKEDKCPVAVFEDPDPTKKPMYPKHLVYVGGRDVQLEELFAVRYWKNMGKENKSIIEPINESLEENVICPPKEIRCKSPQPPPLTQTTQDRRFSMAAAPSTMYSDPKVSSVPVHTGPEPLIAATRMSEPQTSPWKVSEPPALCSSSKPPILARKPVVPVTVYTSPEPQARVQKPAITVYTSPELRNLVKKPSTLQPVPESLSLTPKPLEPRQSEPVAIGSSVTLPLEPEFRKLPVPSESEKSDCSQAGLRFPAPEMDMFAMSNKANASVFCSPSTSFTVNTRAAMNVIQQMWASPLSHPSAKRQKSNDPFDDSLFKTPSAPKINSLDDLLDIPFMRMDLASSSRRADIDDDLLLQPVARSDAENKENPPLPLIVPVNLEDPPLEPENKENYPPKDYSTPSERRPLSGILTPATDILFSEIPAESEESEEDDENCKIHRKTNDFDEETCTTRAFAVPLPSSTPFGNRFSHSRKSIAFNG